MTQQTLDKAAQFIVLDKVKRLPGLGGGVALYAVKPIRADGQTYMVAVRGSQYACSCEAGLHNVACSHGLAAQFYHADTNIG